jgi:hypothetical protein
MDLIFGLVCDRTLNLSKTNLCVLAAGPLGGPKVCISPTDSLRQNHSLLNQPLPHIFGKNSLPLDFIPENFPALILSLFVTYLGEHIHKV